MKINTDNWHPHTNWQTIIEELVDGVNKTNERIDQLIETIILAVKFDDINRAQKFVELLENKPSASSDQ